MTSYIERKGTGTLFLWFKPLQESVVLEVRSSVGGTYTPSGIDDPITDELSDALDAFDDFLRGIEPDEPD